MSAFKRLSQRDHTASESSNVGVAELSCRPLIIYANKWDPIGAARDDLERTNLGSSWVTAWTAGRAGLQATQNGTDLRVGSSILASWEATSVGRGRPLGAPLGNAGPSTPLENAGTATTTNKRPQYAQVMSKASSEMNKRTPKLRREVVPENLGSSPRTICPMRQHWRKAET
jgi:hypothetical protein